MNKNFICKTLDSARLPACACIELKNKQTEVTHKNSEDLNQKIDVLGTH